MKLWKIWAEKTKNRLQIMALVLIKSYSAGFSVQISSQFYLAIAAHQIGGYQTALLNIFFNSLQLILAVN
jgi:hypothetical protein